MSDTQMIRCEACGAMNRVPQDKIQASLVAVCGSCKRPLTPQKLPLVVTDANFAEHVERSPLPVLLDMWAPWCGPCRVLTPVIEELSGELAGRIRVAKLNVDENPVTAGLFRIQSIPALLVLQNGREVDRIVGVRPKWEILRRVQSVLPH